MCHSAGRIPGGGVSLRVVRLLSLSLFLQRFGQYVLRLSSGICRKREPIQNFELRPLLNPRKTHSVTVISVGSLSF